MKRNDHLENEVLYLTNQAYDQFHHQNKATQHKNEEFINKKPKKR
ncbi:hypothetical protein NYQ66_14250 [Aquibacillus koreensis]|nr:hypothetical protein [Aquibacillus koreensis]MCT2536902.1 hypothetical protein [Aquibacillus koreensis]